MGHLYMIRQVLQSTREKPPGIDLEYKIKNILVFDTIVDPSTTKEGKFYSNLCGRFPITSSRGNKYIYAMYVYDCNYILVTAMNSRSG